MTAQAREPARSALAARLLAPARRVDLVALAAEWFRAVIVVRCRASHGLAADVRLLNRVRGALGTALTETASAEALAKQPCPWLPPCALDVLYRTQGHITPGLEIPKPYVLQADEDGTDIVLALTLFGFASDWAEAVAEALVRGLRRGLDLAVTGRELTSSEAVVVPVTAGGALLLFETPLHLRRTEDPDPDAPPDFPALVSSLANRVSGLARWQDAALDLDAGALKSLARSLRVRWEVARPEEWDRYSHLQARSVPMEGTVASALVEGGLEALLPLLALGETCHAGSHAAFGLGRYRLALLPDDTPPVPACRGVGRSVSR